MTVVNDKLIFLSHDTRGTHVRENVRVRWDVVFTIDDFGSE